MSPTEGAPAELRYTDLREAGLQRLQQLTGHRWTDFNAHDPGVTILEQACYALTDLLYRIRFDLRDLLTGPGTTPYDSLHRPDQALCTEPVTLKDLRKIALDVEGVRNAQVHPLESGVPGLVRSAARDSLLLIMDDARDPGEPVDVRGVFQVTFVAGPPRGSHATAGELCRRLAAHRPLCTDFLPPLPMEEEPVDVVASLEIGAAQDPYQIRARVQQTLERHIAPSVRFRPLQEMLARGHSLESLMDGPALVHGFIDDQDLEILAPRSGLRVSDLVREIMAIDGVRLVRDLTLGNSKWYLKLDRRRAPVLGSLDLRLFRGGIQVSVPMQAEPPTSGSERVPPARGLGDLLPPGRDRQVGRYLSLLHHLPAAYGVGIHALPEGASERRKVQALQLKAWLQLLDQPLADSFAQLEHARDLFSFHDQGYLGTFSQPVPDEGLGLDALHESDTRGASSHGEEDLERRNRFLDHLLARVGEHFTAWSELSKERIRDKRTFLQALEHVGGARGTGFDLLSARTPDDALAGVSGLESRVRLKLGLGVPAHGDGYTARIRGRELAGLRPTDAGDFHMVEHILLRPSRADHRPRGANEIYPGPDIHDFLAEPSAPDPYSNQVSFVLPAWVLHLEDPSFRALLERTLREETPAHLRIRLCWLEQTAMASFDRYWGTWRLERARASESDLHGLKNVGLRDARDQILALLGLGRPYPLDDLSLEYPAMVAPGRCARITLRFAQKGVRYQVCDDEGSPLDPTSSSTTGEGSSDEANPVVLTTPPILRDRSFLIKATWDNRTRYLQDLVTVRASVDTSLSVGFVTDPARTGPLPSTVLVDHGARVRVRVDDTQEGYSYRLVRGDDTGDPQPGDVTGDRASRTFDLPWTFEEDTRLRVLVYRTTDPRQRGWLDTVLEVHVRPDPGVQVRAVSSTVPFLGTARLELSGAQTSARYLLYQHPLDPVAFEAGEGLSLRVEDAGRTILLQRPKPWAGATSPASREQVGEFTPGATAGTGGMDTPALVRDTWFEVVAVKKDNGSTVLLSQVAAVLVRPDPGVRATWGEVTLAGEPVPCVVLTGTEPGVRYQLQTGGTPLGEPGHPPRERGIGRMRVQVDLQVEDDGTSPSLFLPAEGLTPGTRLEVLATRLASGVSTKLAWDVTVWGGR